MGKCIVMCAGSRIPTISGQQGQPHITANLAYKNRGVNAKIYGKMFCLFSNEVDRIFTYLHFTQDVKQLKYKKCPDVE